MAGGGGTRWARRAVSLNAPPLQCRWASRRPVLLPGSRRPPALPFPSFPLPSLSIVISIRRGHSFCLLDSQSFFFLFPLFSFASLLRQSRRQPHRNTRPLFPGSHDSPFIRLDDDPRSLNPDSKSIFDDPDLRELAPAPRGRGRPSVYVLASLHPSYRSLTLAAWTTRRSPPLAYSKPGFYIQ